ncbi:MAG: flavodoxin domain-containing protein [Candidatus Thorarchaeota archaeon]
MKTLIAFSTRYGATESTSKEIAKILTKEGFDVRVVNLKKEKLKDISEYDLVLIGSGMKMGNWCKESEKFLERFQEELRNKKTVIFVSSGARVILEHDKQVEEMENDWQKYLVEKGEEYSLNPVDYVMFGGVWDYNKMGFLFRKTLVPFKIKLEEIGIEELEPGVYDTRNWEIIRQWSKELAEKVR